MTVTYRTYVWIEDGRDEDALILGGLDTNEAYVIEAAENSVVKLDD